MWKKGEGPTRAQEGVKGYLSPNINGHWVCGDSCKDNLAKHPLPPCFFTIKKYRKKKQFKHIYGKFVALIRFLAAQQAKHGQFLPHGYNRNLLQVRLASHGRDLLSFVPKRIKLPLCPFLPGLRETLVRNFHILPWNAVLLKWVHFRGNLGLRTRQRHIFSDVIVCKEHWGGSATKHTLTQCQGCSTRKAKQLPKGSKLIWPKPPIAAGSRVPKPARGCGSRKDFARFMCQPRLTKVNQFFSGSQRREKTAAD